MIKKALNNLNITALNEMQDAALAADNKRDLVILSPTGSGKTLAFLLPLLQTLDAGISLVQVLVLVPSRELALQIEQVFRVMGTGFKVSCCYGGHSTKTEKNNLLQPPAVLIGTPGRIAHHLRHENFSAEAINTLVLDEFDKSLEFGFQQDMSGIIRQLERLGRRVLTSATRMDSIPSFTGVKNPVQLNYLDNYKAVPDLKLKALIAEPAERLEILLNLICWIGNKATLVFCNHREAVDRISDTLWQKGLIHDVFHGGMEQEDRERALIKFRNGSHSLLITTDLASRGLDIPDIEYVVHYQLPATREAFVHRNGRTARMHATGTAYLLLSPGDEIKYLTQQPEVEIIPDSLPLPQPGRWVTLYIGAGKKDKVNKVDIVGLILKKGGISKDEVGLIEVLDNTAYAAVKREKAELVVRILKGEKVKGKKVKIEISA